MIRRFFPKGTNFDEISSQEIRKIQDWMNAYPRKSLNWLTPTEAAG
jgi:IS30 family transposase